MRTEGPSDAAKIRVLKRDKFTCTYCGVDGTRAELEIDHIIPASKGGSNHISNLTTACRRCNLSKSANPAKPSFRPSKTVSMETHINGVTGLFVHILNPENGSILRQGRVISDRGELVMVQLFSFMDGEPGKVIPVPVSDLMDGKKCTMYATGRQMSRAFWEQMYEQGKMRGTVEEQLLIEDRITGNGDLEQTS